MTRADGRAADQLRPVEIIPNFTKFAEGSVLIRCGDTVVLCNASVEDKTPPDIPRPHTHHKAPARVLVPYRLSISLRPHPYNNPASQISTN